MPRTLSASEEQRFTQNAMHELGAHAAVLITVYPDERGTRCSFVVCSVVPERAYTAMGAAIRSGLTHCMGLLKGWLGGDGEAKGKAN